MMSRWNTSCGVSIHAELVGKAWINMGHELTVLAPIENKVKTQRDEPYVIRCYTLEEGWRNDSEPYFDPKPFLEGDFDIFVAQNLEMLPMKELLEIYPLIREKAKTILVVHEGNPPNNPYFYKFDWDAVVCFDDRYKDFLKNIYSLEKIRIIPYPCHPIKEGNKLKARKKLNLPMDKKIIFNYGLGVFRHIHLIPTIERLSRKYPLIMLTLTHINDWIDLFSVLKKRYRFIELRQGAISTDELYDYLHASDVLLIHKDSADAVVVSSTVYLCMGSGCPLLVSDSNFFDTLEGEVLKYRGLDMFARKLEDIFEKREIVKDTLRRARDYVLANSDREIGKQFIELFTALITRKKEKFTFLGIETLQPESLPQYNLNMGTKNTKIVNFDNPFSEEKKLKSA